MDYWKCFILLFNKTLKKVDASTRLKYVIERTERDIPHLHFITTFEKVKVLRRLLNENYITTNENDMNKL